MRKPLPSFQAYSGVRQNPFPHGCGCEGPRFLHLAGSQLSSQKSPSSQRLLVVARIIPSSQPCKQDFPPWLLTSASGKKSIQSNSFKKSEATHPVAFTIFFWLEASHRFCLHSRGSVNKKTSEHQKMGSSGTPSSLSTVLPVKSLKLNCQTE